MRDSQWFKTESVLCALVPLVRYGYQSPTRDLKPPYFPCGLSHYSLLLVLVFCGGLLFFSSPFFSPSVPCILSKDASFLPGGGFAPSKQVSIVV